MRAVDCPCGEHLEGTNDIQVLDAMKEHANEEHEGEYSDVDLKVMVNTSAYDTAA
jgi:hypothetical protein